MIQEDKQLLLRDLCARLPYGVIVRHADPFVDNDGNETGKFWHKRGYLCDITTLDDMTTTIIESEGSDAEGYEHICFLERTVPYLRPMSSMTEEEREDFYQNVLDMDIEDVRYENDGKLPLPYNQKDKFIWFENIYLDNTFAVIDWLNAHHFDYRNLIEKALAIEVTEENNPYKG